jgi:peptidoglycan pentaglycine glycine transferase (the first glycine)
MISEPIEINDPKDWDTAVVKISGGHLLQSWQWGELKGKYGWSPHRYLWKHQNGRVVAAAQLLFRSIAERWTIAYCPKGPLVDWSDHSLQVSALNSLAFLASQQDAIFLKIDPELVIGTGVPGDEEAVTFEGTKTIRESWREAGWRRSDEQIQFKNTMVIPLDLDEEALLMDMKSKTRYNVRLAGRRGVSVVQGSIEDLDLLYRMYAETSVRDGFVIRHQGYYEDAWGKFIEANLAQPFIAKVEGRPIAGLIAYRFGSTAYYLYGMSTSDHREKMPNYLLQWEAMRWAKEQGCTRYDLWGAPESIEEDDPMYGVYRFKEGFGAELVRTTGAWDLPLKPVHYDLYSRLMPLALAAMRRLGRARTRQVIDS